MAILMVNGHHYAYPSRRIAMQATGTLQAVDWHCLHNIGMGACNSSMEEWDGMDGNGKGLAATGQCKGILDF